LVRAFALALALLLPAAAPAEPLAEAAAAQVGVTLIYDPRYVALDFPGGDISRLRGVCTDVVIRAMRDALGVDLQAVVNADMTAAFAEYPAIWGLGTTDRNIDHRRVPNLEVLFARAGAALPISDVAGDYLPGDIVSFRLAGSEVPHVGIVSDRTDAGSGRPLVTHNIGWGTRTEDMLFDHRITGHFRLGPEALDWLRARQG
jgi:uncharacterized protein YijF (DUF1287 family)